uniref:Putative ovule protein n=1 Tax=Solanum chacoense TaxID=4108 RepID=A0A0V0I559_SOLCH
MHTKTDSEDTSLAPSSPDNTRPTAYYVQSPSRDSHDGEKTTTSFHSTPVISPMGSPPHSHSSVGRHSRDSSSSRFSGSLKPGSRKILPDAAAGVGGRHHRKGQKPWKECDVIEEEGLLEDDRSSKSLPRRCYVLAFVVGFFILFSFFALILWGASRPQKPKITMRTIKFDHFGIQAGSDATGVATDMISMNATVKFLYRNTASFFGVHVTSSPLDLSFSELTIGSGAMKKFYQSRKSQRVVAVSVIGNKIPLYGGGASLSTPSGATPLPVPLKLNFKLRSRAYVLGKMVKPKFYKTIDCLLTLHPQKMNAAISLKNCTYT